jgi:hypothetical protein
MSRQLMNAAGATAPPGVEETLTFTAMAPLVLAVGRTAGSEHVVATPSVIMPTTNRASALHRVSTERQALALIAPPPIRLAFTARRDRVISLSEIVAIAGGATAIRSITRKGKTFTLGTPTPV